MHIRSFIAVAISEQVRRAAEKLLKELKPAGGHGVRWVDPAAMHITLSFLGNIGENDIVPLMDLIRQATRDTAAFALDFRGLDAFPSLGRIRTIIVPVLDETGALSKIQRNLHVLLAEKGYRVENRKFVPHLTLGRVKGNVRGTRLREALEERAAVDLGSCWVREVFLMRSDLTPRGARYTPMGHVSL